MLLIVQLLCGIGKNRNGMTRCDDGVITPSQGHITPDFCSNYFGSTLLSHSGKTQGSVLGHKEELSRNLVIVLYNNLENDHIKT